MRFIKLIFIAVSVWLATVMVCQAAMASTKNYKITMKSGEIIEFSIKSEATRFINAGPNKIKSVIEWRELEIKPKFTLGAKQ